MNNLSAFRIDRVGNAILTVSTEQTVFERQHADDIAANWHAASDANPALFNGIVHLCASAQIDGDGLQATCHAVRFATLLYWRKLVDGAGFRNTFGDVILCGSDGKILIGHMAGHTANAGRWCLPGGSFDESDVVDGRIDPRRCISRECAEETGFCSGDYVLDPELLVYRDDRYVAFAQIGRLKISGPEARERILGFLAKEPEPELDNIRVVHSAADAEAWIPDTYEARLIAHVFREKT